MLEAFQQETAGRLLLVRAGDPADLGQAGVDGVAEQPQVFCDGVVGDGGQALVAGQVRLVDEGAQLTGGLDGPNRVRVGLGGVFEIPEQVLWLGRLELGPLGRLEVAPP